MLIRMLFRVSLERCNSQMAREFHLPLGVQEGRQQLHASYVEPHEGLLDG